MGLLQPSRLMGRLPSSTVQRLARQASSPLDTCCCSSRSSMKATTSFSLRQGQRHPGLARRLSTLAAPVEAHRQQPSSSRASAARSSDSGSGPEEVTSPSTSTADAGPVNEGPSRPRYSPLHFNVENFCKRIVPTEDERKSRMQVIEGIRACTRKAFPDVRKANVEVFGSFANGLSTWSSDVDLVVTGLMEPDRLTGVYDVQERGKVTARLRRIADQLRRYKKLDVRRLAIISRARMPIIKVKTKNNVSVDISIGDDAGPRAARYMTQQARAYPPLKPLVLVLKSYLRALNLNDVAHGGLSSYSLCNMVIVHLQEELKDGHDVFDLGETLYSFLLRYGEEFNYELDAVSVASGGIVPKSALGLAPDQARFIATNGNPQYNSGAVSVYERLCVDCPLTGRDVSNGTYRIDIVRDAFVRAARKLEALARGRKISDTSINYLQAIFDVERVTRRTHYQDHEDAFIKVVGGREPPPPGVRRGGPSAAGGGGRGGD